MNELQTDNIWHLYSFLYHRVRKYSTCVKLHEHTGGCSQEFFCTNNYNKYQRVFCAAQHFSACRSKTNNLLETKPSLPFTQEKSLETVFSMFTGSNLWIQCTISQGCCQGGLWPPMKRYYPPPHFIPLGSSLCSVIF